jgi:hypothetical protein
MQTDRTERTKQLAANFVVQASDVLKTKKTSGNYSMLEAGPKQTGALRRLSMDLTRALAEMRRP